VKLLQSYLLKSGSWRRRRRRRAELAYTFGLIILYIRVAVSFEFLALLISFSVLFILHFVEPINNPE
jgi:hypothetical protein